MSEFDSDGGGEAAVRRALTSGVKKMILPNVDLSTIEPLDALTSAFPDVTFAAMGLHPTEVKDSWRDDLYLINTRLSTGNYVAVGEIGIDLYWEKDHRDEQMQAFDRQVAMAVELDLPLIIHCRDGLAETLEVLEAHPQARGIFHSFGGTQADVEAIRRRGDFFFGINGIVTFKNSTLRDVLPDIGLDRILLETDSPYLAPVPRRGKRNESAFLPFIAAHIAASLDVTAAHVDEVTSCSASKLFGLETA
ncbi:MAG: TatD family hydrolase [Odoribacter sp.]|nr:TatD family hydrolase [Odoribacter sp.]